MIANSHPPGRYEPALEWLAAHPGATLTEVADGIGGTRERALLCLRYGMAHETVRRDRTTDREPWRWYRAPAPEPAQTDAEWLYGNSPAGLRYRAAEELAAEFGVDISEFLV